MSCVKGPCMFKKYGVCVLYTVGVYLILSYGCIVYMVHPTQPADNFKG